MEWRCRSASTPEIARVSIAADDAGARAPDQAGRMPSAKTRAAAARASEPTGTGATGAGAGDPGAGDPGAVGAGANDGAPELSLDALVDWCGRVIRDALAGGADVVTTRPPLPEHVRRPLARHGFDVFDEAALALIVGPDLDPVVGLGMSELTGVPGSRYATVAVIADLLGAREAERVAVVSRLSADAPLARMGLVELFAPADAPSADRGGPSLLQIVAASGALLRWMFGVTQLDPTLFPLVRDDLTAPSEPPDATVAASLALRLGRPHPSVTTLLGAADADLLSTALHGARRAERPALRVDAAALADPRLACRVAAEALLRDAVVIAVGAVAGVLPQRWDAFASIVAVGAEPVVTAGCGHDVLSLTVTAAQGAAVGAHLVELLRTRGLAVSPDDAERLGRWQHLRHEDLAHVAAVLRARVPREGRQAVSARDVAMLVAGGADDDLARLATPLETSRAWDSLIAPAELQRDLRELVLQAETRVAVLRAAGFDAPGQSLGVSAVFAGPSGTGKTMAARLVAGELGLPLYAVNLATVVSKYIGETERNLDAVFAAAERADAVLLFDEAEALFGRRSEVQDARDRYANIEIAFLLQRVERYDGVAILATNLLDHFDEAFARRLSFCVRFPYPDEGQRLLLWQGVWPAGTAFAPDVDLAAVAVRHPFAGGHIRNIAVAAVHLAHTRAGVVDAACLQRAIEREYAKLGQTGDLLAGVLS